MQFDPLASKIMALAVSSLERHALGAAKETDIADKITGNVLARIDENQRSLVLAQTLQLRHLSTSYQKRFLGKYFDRSLSIGPVIPSGGPVRAIPATYDRVTVRRGLSGSIDPSRSVHFSSFADYLKRIRDAASAGEPICAPRKHVSLELDRLEVIDEDDPGKAEVLLVGGSSDGTAEHVHSLITQTKKIGSHATLYYTGADRVAVPKWPLREDGTSTISFYCNVTELDEHDRDDIVKKVGGAQGVATNIISGLIAVGAITGGAGAIAGAVALAVGGLISFLAGLNNDDDWKSHQISLSGPFDCNTPSPTAISSKRKPGGEEYKLHFIRYVYN